MPDDKPDVTIDFCGPVRVAALTRDGALLVAAGLEVEVAQLKRHSPGNRMIPDLQTVIDALDALTNNDKDAIILEGSF